MITSSGSNMACESCFPYLPVSHRPASTVASATVEIMMLNLRVFLFMPAQNAKRVADDAVARSSESVGPEPQQSLL